MMHYSTLIKMFGTPNGLCSSLTESQHIKAVKEPWRRSNHYEALDQMLVTNQHIDKLAAAQVNYSKRGMLQGALLPIGAAADDQVTYDNDDGQGAVEDPPEATMFDVQLACHHDTSEHSSHGWKKTDSLICSMRSATFSSRHCDALWL